jgi:hypothetical protein
MDAKAMVGNIRDILNEMGLNRRLAFADGDIPGGYRFDMIEPDPPRSGSVNIKGPVAEETAEKVGGTTRGASGGVGSNVNWTGKNFNDIGKSTNPEDLINNLESSGWSKVIEAGGGGSGPATILTDPVTGTKVRIMANPAEGSPYFRVQNAGGNHLGSDGLYPSNATRQELRDLTYFYFEN